MKKINRLFTDHHPIFSKFKSLFKVFKSSPEIINLNSSDTNNTQPAIFLANHSAAGGPFTLGLYFPRNIVPWGAHEMCGDYQSRWKYLYNVFYQQKLGWHKAPAFLMASGFAVISGMVYDGAELIPTYKDARFAKTIRMSLRALENGKDILIFPENSDDGYHDVLTEYHPGFILLAKKYKQRTGRDIPIYTVYYSGKENKVIIDEPVYLSSFDEGTPRERIAEFFKDKTNELYSKFIINKQVTA